MSLLTRLRRLLREQGLDRTLRLGWAAAWMRLGWLPLVGRPARAVAAWPLPPLYGQRPLARLHPRGWVSPRARIGHPRLQTGRHVYLGPDVLVHGDATDSGRVELGDDVHVYDGTVIQTDGDAHVRIGARTSLQPRCQLSAYVSGIDIGEDVAIAPQCAFYPYDHLVGEEGLKVLTSKGPVVVEDHAVIGYGAVVLSGVTIGARAVIGAGSVVTSDVPPDTVAAGNPARVIRTRSGAPARD